MISDGAFSKQVDRNLEGQTLEKSGNLDKATELYEKNVTDGFEGNFPYDRLAIIYRKQGKQEDEVRILKKAIEVFRKIPGTRPDKLPKLKKFMERLSKLNTN